MVSTRWYSNKYYVDEFYNAVVVRPLVAVSRTVLWRGIDAGLIDGTVNGVGTRSRGVGSILRLLQSGNIRTYAAWVVLGSILVLIAIGFAGGEPMTLLDLVIFLPLVAFLLILFIPKNSMRRNPALQPARFLAIFCVLAQAAWAVLVFEPRKIGFSKRICRGLIRRLSVITLRSTASACGWCLLTTLLTPLCVLVSWRSVQNRVKEFFAFLLLLEFGLIGVFCAFDLFLFFVFWEVSLVPMYFPDRHMGPRSAHLCDGKILPVYLCGIDADAGGHHLSLQSGRNIRLFENPDWAAKWLHRLHLSGAIAVVPRPSSSRLPIKVPLFPLHTWLPDAHVEAPTAGSVMLASVMLKMGTYGLLRFCVPMFPVAAHNCSGWIVALAIIGIVYGALVAMVQPNMKKLVAYSSVSHLGFRGARNLQLHPAGIRWRGLPDAESRRLHRRSFSRW